MRYTLVFAALPVALATFNWAAKRPVPPAPAARAPLTAPRGNGRGFQGHASGARTGGALGGILPPAEAGRISNPGRGVPGGGRGFQTVNEDTSFIQDTASSGAAASLQDLDVGVLTVLQRPELSEILYKETDVEIND